MAESWSRLRNEQLRNLYSSKKNQHDKITEYEMGGTRSMQGGEQNAYRNFVGEAVGNRPLVTSTRRWDNSI
jgi:hypothetical protein